MTERFFVNCVICSGLWWCLLHVALHHWAASFVSGAPSRRRYWSRLVRSEIYAVWATAVGGLLLATSYDSVHALLHARSRASQLAFGVAAGHWIVTCFEEVTSSSFALAGLRLGATKSARHRLFLATAFLAHHVAAAAVYIYAGLVGELGSLGALGLWYELPVALVNIRDHAIEFSGEGFAGCVSAATRQRWLDKPPTPDDTSSFWAAILTAFWFGRGPATALYVTSLCVTSWQREIALCDQTTRLAYHAFGCGFTILNIGWRCMLSLWMIRDMKRSYAFARGGWRAVEEEEEEEESLLEGSNILDQSMPPPGADAEDLIRPVDTTSRVVIDADELSRKHARQWVAIHGVVYDVRAFVDRHPGGIDVLVNAAGTDATEAFEAAGHSPRARQILVSNNGERHGIRVVGALRRAVGVRDDDNIAIKGKLSKTPRDMLWAVDRTVPYSYLAGHWDVLPPIGGVCWTHVAAGFALLSILPARASSHFLASASPKIVDIAALFFASMCMRNEPRKKDESSEASTPTKDDAERRKQRRSALLCITALVGAVADVVVTMALGGLSLASRIWTGAHVLALAIEAVLFEKKTLSNGSTLLSRRFAGTMWGLGLVASARPILQTEPRYTIVLGASMVAAMRATRHLGETDNGAVWARSLRRVTASGLAAAACFVSSMTPQTSSTPNSACALFVDTLTSGTYFRSGSTTTRSLELQGQGGGNAISMPAAVARFVSLAMLYVAAWALWRARDRAALKLRQSTSDAFVSRAHAFTGLCFGLVFGQAVVGKLLLTLVVAGHAMWLDSAHRDALAELGPASPAYWYGWQTLVDRLKLGISFAFRQLATVVVGLANLTAPRGGFWYLAPTPIPELEGVDYGVSLLAKGDLHSGPAESFQLNIGHLHVFPGSDAIHTASATAEMLGGLARNENGAKERGFVANVVSFIPDSESGMLREINLSAWASDEAAHDWYVNNLAHQKTVRRYYNRGMSTFSSMLGSLRPSKDLRFHARCQHCHALQREFPSQATCPQCGRPVRMPLF
ncbi:hypothetical protein CTAYLR_008368 [Chrysophaeum taylorii]|uniref:Cytochrome b5 heme-binding domain-containing protein n=1 Tax=Chrysophaeum taylorii TaxID=2483200 RepID=A0AAD7UMW3_9STRA|nr:hypothetical protein CTAYLR_008368 [Chrysophaeum taylorii]